MSVSKLCGLPYQPRKKGVLKLPHKLSLHTYTAKKFFHDAVVKVIRPDLYLDLLRMCQETDVSKNMSFQHLYTYFYRVRRSSEWLNGYYRLFEEFKSKHDVTIRDILISIASLGHNGRNTIELSFASKMLATIQPDMPIWDNLVREKLKIAPLPTSGKFSDRIESAITAYGILTNRTQELLSDPGVQLELKEIDVLLPEYSGMTAMRKLDFMLWGSNL